MVVTKLIHIVIVQMANNSKFASVNRFAVLASPKGSPKGSPKIKPVITIKTDSGVSNTTSERSADSPPPLLAPIPVVATPPRLGTPYNYAKAAMKNLSPQSAGQKIHFRTKVEEIDEIESPVAADFSEFWDGLAKKAQRDINEQRITERARILLPSDEDIIRAFLPDLQQEHRSKIKLIFVKAFASPMHPCRAVFTPQ